MYYSEIVKIRIVWKPQDFTFLFFYFFDETQDFTLILLLVIMLRKHNSSI